MFAFPELVASWVSARSVVRNLPAPIPDRGGLRVETNSEKEVRRWVFPQFDAGIGQIGIEAALPHHFIKLCGADADLRSQLSKEWTILPTSYFMMADTAEQAGRPLTAGYELQCLREGRTIVVRMRAADGSLVNRAGFAGGSIS